MKTEDKSGYIPFPECFSRRKLNSLYRAIPLEDKVIRLLRRYFSAMCNLYGIIPLHKAFEIIDEQNPGLITRGDFEAFAEIARHEDAFSILGADELYLDGKPVQPMDRELIDDALLFDDSDLISKVAGNQRDKPYYLPAKRELLRYEDNAYCQPSPQAAALEEFIHAKLGLEEQKAAEVFEEIVFLHRSGFLELSELMDVINDQGARFRKGDWERFMEVYYEFHNNARMQCNRGHTPNEIAAMLPPEDRIPRSLTLGPNIMKNLQDGSWDVDELRKSFLSMEMPSEELRASLLRQLDGIKPAAAAGPRTAAKVGRNEPCPCGSGKKYKKCCGR